MQLRQRTAASIGLLVVLLFFPASLVTLGGGFPLEIALGAQCLCYLVSFGLFLTDRDSGAGSTLQALAFAFVGAILAMTVMFVIGMSGMGSSGF